MKRLIAMSPVFAIAVTLLFQALQPTAHAQESQETVTIPKSSLTEQQKAELTAKTLSDKQAAFGKWVGIGDEVGKAVNGGLSALTTQANNFAQTPLGKWTMFVVIFKVVGEKAIQYFVGISMLIIGFPIWLWSYRKYLPKKFLVKVNYSETGKKLSEEYNYGYGIASDTRYTLDKGLATSWAIGHWFAFMAYFIIAIAVMFVGN